MEIDPYSAESKQQRTRAIIITTAIAVIVLGIAAWAIIAIVGSRSNNTVSDANNTVAVDDTAARNKVAEEEPVAPTTEGVSTNVEPEKPAVTTAAATTTRTTVPETGPEELLPLALVAGIATAYVASKKLAKSEA